MGVDETIDLERNHAWLKFDAFVGCEFFIVLCLVVITASLYRWCHPQKDGESLKRRLSIASMEKNRGDH